MPHFSNDMSYPQILDAIRHVQLESRLPSLSEWECLSKSLENPSIRALLKIDLSGIKTQLAVLAAKTGYSNALNVLLNPPHSVSPNYECPQERETLLMLATLKGHTETVKALIHAGADVNHCNQDKETALMTAASNGYTEIVKALIHAGADVNHRDQYKETALMTAASNGYTEIVKALIAAGANVNHRTQDRETALMTAASNGYTEIVKALIAAGANVNHRTQDRETALMIATSKGHIEIVNALSAAVNHVNSNGKTALQPAKNSPNIDMVNMPKKEKRSQILKNLMSSFSSILKRLSPLKAAQRSSHSQQGIQLRNTPSLSSNSRQRREPSDRNGLTH